MPYLSVFAASERSARELARLEIVNTLTRRLAAWILRCRMLEENAPSQMQRRNV
jgi:hypothetical protein